MVDVMPLFFATNLQAYQIQEGGGGSATKIKSQALPQQQDG